MPVMSIHLNGVIMETAIVATAPTFRLSPSFSAGFRHRSTFSSTFTVKRAGHLLFSRLSPSFKAAPSRFTARSCAFQRSDTGNFDASSLNGKDVVKTVLDFTASNFLPIALISAVALGMANPSSGCYAHKYSLSKYTTFGTFVISGLKLKGKEIGEVAEAWPVAIFGLTSILLLTPFFSYLILQVPLAPQEFVTGLAIFCCVPTTLTSGVTLTQLVGGNTALALSITVISNLLGVLAVPFWVSTLVADGFGISIPTGNLFWSLIFTLLVPLVLGKVVRNSFKGLATCIDKNSRTLSIINTILLSVTPWMQVSKSRPLLLLVKPEVFIEAIGMGILVHLALLGFNIILVQALSAGFGGKDSVFAKKKNARAILIVCSQKALLTVTVVVEQLNDTLGQSGLLILPCVAAHINQIVIDSFLVNFWIHKDKSCKHVKEL